MSVSDVSDVSDWDKEKHYTQLVWDVHQKKGEALFRPYQDVQDAAAYLAARLEALYTEDGAPTVAIDINKMNGLGVQMENATIQSVRAALKHLSARRIWSTRSNPNPNTDDNNIRICDFLTKFPNMRTHVETVFNGLLEPVVLSSGVEEDAVDPDSCISVDMQLRMQAQGNEDALFQYMNFVTDVVHTWHSVNAACGALDHYNFSALSAYAHATQGEEVRDKIFMARQLCQIEFLQILAWDAGGVRLRMALPSPLRLRCSMPTPNTHPPLWISCLNEHGVKDGKAEPRGGGGVHAVHFRMPDQACTQLELQLDAATARAVHVSPDCSSVPIGEPESLGVLLMGVSCGAASVAGTLLLTQTLAETHPCGATLACVLLGLAGAAAGVVSSKHLLLRMRARRAWSTFLEWSTVMHGGTHPDAKHAKKD